MATKREDAAAAKAKKQKIILVIGGVLLLGLGAIQGPKLLKGSSSTTEPAPAGDVASPTTVAAAAVSTPSGGTATVAKVSAGPQPTAILAGVTIQSGRTAAIDAGQLLRFNLFEAKDPFVPQTSDELSGATEPTAEPTLSDTQPGTSGSTATAAPTGSNDSAAQPAAAPPAAAPPATTNATIIMNSKAYYLALKDRFPQADPLFVLVSLKPKVARIGVAGGAFSDGKTIALAQGKKVTVVNETTGTRYVLKLVYTGAAPEQTESFTQAEK